VTDGDLSELNEVSDQLTEVLDINNPHGGPSPAEFAEQTFADGVQARHVEAGFDGHQGNIDDMNAETVGTWNSFDRGDIVDREPLKDAVDVEGRTADQMEEVTLADSDGRAANKAYVTNYDHNSGHPNAPSKQNAHSQMAVSSALDAMGVEAPRHHYDSETNQVFVESVSRPGYDTEIAEDVSTEYADRVDPDQMKDMMAANIVTGNVDVKADNLMVGEDGNVVAFDFDFTDKNRSIVNAAAMGGKWMNDAIEKVNSSRSEPLGFTSDDVLDRSEEIATQLQESGAVDRVAEAAEQYDEYFTTESDSDFGGFERTSRDDVGQRIRIHAHNWSE